MLNPDKVQSEAKKKENENMKFRTFLKCNANPEKLDRQFARLHSELFANYDCSKCRNCCKMYYGSIPENELEKAASHLKMTVKELIDTYLIEEKVEQTYSTKHIPCDFLEKDGSCMLGDTKPENCKKYPYTDQPDRLASMYTVLEAVEVCPVAFEILEQLKKEYRFRTRKRY